MVGGSRRVRWAVLALVAIATVACGSAAPQPPNSWAAAHPDPQGMQFKAAEGLCVFSVRYPNDAPGEIDWQQNVFIQHDRTSPPPASTTVVARSGDWTVHQPSPHQLILVTPAAAYDYRDGAKCGNNSAPPT
ncbi:MAG TPA: hypothetical protein VGQ42_08820 [Candidatus Dormibacteraeota bacterium]|jgi:hypothetical protein|nr:hypothetical protein [Candidatus Dormibacteraeota bacterium]